MGFTLLDIARNLVLAARWTVLLSLIAFVGGGLLGALVLYARISPRVWMARLARGYVEAFQGTPLLIQLFIIFFGLSLVGVTVSSLAAASLGLILWTAAFLAEIWRGCVEAIPRGQWEASSSLAMGRLQQMRHVVLPQALRIAVAPTVGFSVQVVKGTALTSIIGFVELARAGTVLTNATYRPFLVYGLVALLYFCLCWPLSQASRVLERRLHAPHRG